jgi:ABC-type glutathione transport system ATPase component
MRYRRAKSVTPAWATRFRLLRHGWLAFDEPTSTRDPASEAQVTQLLLDMARGHRALVVSHHLALTRLVDRIVVLEHGHIVEQGSHEQLMRRGDRQATMFEHQPASTAETRTVLSPYVARVDGSVAQVSQGLITLTRAAR